MQRRVGSDVGVVGPLAAVGTPDRGKTLPGSREQRGPGGASTGARAGQTHCGFPGSPSEARSLSHGPGAQQPPPGVTAREGRGQSAEPAGRGRGRGTIRPRRGATHPALWPTGNHKMAHLPLFACNLGLCKLLGATYLKLNWTSADWPAQCARPRRSSLLRPRRAVLLGKGGGVYPAVGWGCTCWLLLAPRAAEGAQPARSRESDLRAGGVPGPLV